MTALQKAKQSIQDLATLIRGASQARIAFEARRTNKLVAPRATQLRITGNAMIRIVDADTGVVLGFRQTISEARSLQCALERGDYSNGRAQQ